MTTTAPQPAPLVPLVNEEKRILNILTSPISFHLLKQRFSPNISITLLHERLIDAQNNYEEHEKLTLVLNPIFIEPGQGETPQEAFPPSLYQFLQAAVERQLKVRNNILRLLMYTHHIVSLATDILGRGTNAIATVRSLNLCQNCGYGGHWPVECPQWKCSTCHTWGPCHLPQNCPHYVPPYPRRRTIRHIRPMPTTHRSTPRPTAQPRPVPPPQRRPLANRVPPQPTLPPFSDSDSDQENRMLLPTERYYNSSASNPTPSPHPSTLNRPQIVIEPTTAEPSPQPQFSPLQTEPSTVPAPTINGHVQPTEAMMHQVFDAIDTHPPASSATEADWSRLRQAFEPSGSQATVTEADRNLELFRIRLGLEPGEEPEVDERGFLSQRLRQNWFESTGTHMELTFTPTREQGNSEEQSFQEAQDTNTGQ